MQLGSLFHDTSSPFVENFQSNTKESKGFARSTQHVARPGGVVSDTGKQCNRISRWRLAIQTLIWLIAVSTTGSGIFVLRPIFASSAQYCEHCSSKLGMHCKGNTCPTRPPCDIDRAGLKQNATICIPHQAHTDIVSSVGGPPRASIVGQLWLFCQDRLS